MSFVSEGQRWRSSGDGHVVAIVARAAPRGWIVRIEGSEVLVDLDETDLLDAALDELVASNESLG